MREPLVSEAVLLSRLPQFRGSNVEIFFHPRYEKGGGLRALMDDSDVLSLLLYAVSTCCRQPPKDEQSFWRHESSDLVLTVLTTTSHRSVAVK